jgi:release factor glutamine methyltransferase
MGSVPDLDLADLAAALRHAEARLDRVDARVLLCHVLRRDAAYLITHPQAPLTPEERSAFVTLVERRAGGEPVAYLTESREFFGHRFRVSPAVLIPRPETELVVELALERLPAARAARVLDLGTGSGCIAISIALARPRATVQAADRSPEAIGIARENAGALGAANVRFLVSDWFSALAHARFDVIVANPPYVAAGDAHLEQDDLRFEPRLALEAGVDGLDALRCVVATAPTHLAPAGWLFVEHGYAHAESVRALLRAAGFDGVFSATDLAGIERVTGGRLTPRGALQ